MSNTTREDLVNYMVQRFLQWELPETFSPDGGIKFERTVNRGTPYEYRHRPVGTNLLTAEEARKMVTHMIDGLSLD